jgi:hypothetical protein
MCSLVCMSATLGAPALGRQSLSVIATAPASARDQVLCAPEGNSVIREDVLRGLRKRGGRVISCAEDLARFRPETRVAAARSACPFVAIRS